MVQTRAGFNLEKRLYASLVILAIRKNLTSRKEMAYR